MMLKMSSTVLEMYIGINFGIYFVGKIIRGDLMYSGSKVGVPFSFIFRLAMKINTGNRAACLVVSTSVFSYLCELDTTQISLF